ncbi:hypothetical protein [Streptomyces sp. PA5.6]|uniref:hypothetical protein n=1 Tax=Streptomyces sp. PA5.6 TaxID=3035651 RepID=UPI0039046936
MEHTQRGAPRPFANQGLRRASTPGLTTHYARVRQPADRAAVIAEFARHERFSTIALMVGAVGLIGGMILGAVVAG